MQIILVIAAALFVLAACDRHLWPKSSSTRTRVQRPAYRREVPLSQARQPMRMTQTRRTALHASRRWGA